MKATFFKTGTNVLLQCNIEEIREDETIRVRLLEDGQSYKIGEPVHTLKENIFSVDLGVVQRIANKAGYPGVVTPENVKEIIKSLAENYSEILASETQRLYKKAVDQYTGSESTSEYWENLTHKIDSIFALLDIYTDYPGLYPTFELDRKGKHFCETSTESALKQYNNFWGHW